MSNVNTLVKAKPCFGKYENWDNSWHCKGCPLKEDCEQNKEEENNECTEN